MRKITRNIEKYGLDGLNEELRNQRQDGASLRSLAAYSNQRILERALAEANVGIVGDVETIYETLDGDETSRGRHAEMRARLARRGVPIDEVTDDFVSHQTMSEYLRDCLEIDTSRRKELTMDEATDTIEWAKARATAVIERTLTRLADAGEVTTTDIDVNCSLQVTCENCGDAYRLYTFLDQGGCDCTTHVVCDA